MRQWKRQAKLLRDTRRMLGLSQEDLSYLIGIKAGQMISNIERNLCGIPPKKVSVIASVLKVPAGKFVDAMMEDYQEMLLDAVWSETSAHSAVEQGSASQETSVGNVKDQEGSGC